MKRIVIVRHSKAIANEQGILMGGKLDSPLSENGIKLARDKGRALKAAGFNPDKVITSALMRAQQTAEIILDELGVDLPIETLAELNERDFGQYDNRPYKYVLEAFDTYEGDPPTVEPVDDFVARVLKGFETVKQKAGKVTLVVTHSNPEMVMQTAVQNPEKVATFWELGDPPYCEGFEFTLP